MNTSRSDLARAAARSLRGFVDIEVLRGVDADEQGLMFLKAAGAAVGLMIGRKKAAAAMRMVARELTETQSVDDMLEAIDSTRRCPD